MKRLGGEHDVVAPALQRPADPAYQSFLSSQGAERKSLSPAETTAFVKKDKEAMARLLDSLGLLVK